MSGKPIKLVGRGERMEDLEPFYPDRMAGRILGMGDVLSFVEKAQEVMRQEDAEELQKTTMSVKFDFNDFLKQTRAVGCCRRHRCLRQLESSCKGSAL